MSFEEEFPSIVKDYPLDASGGFNFMHQDFDDVELAELLQKYCLDKERVRNAIEKLLDKTDYLHELECGCCDEEWKEFERELGL